MSGFIVSDQSEKANVYFEQNVYMKSGRTRLTVSGDEPFVGGDFF